MQRITKQKTSKKWLLLALVPALAAVYFYMHHEPAEVEGEATVMMAPEDHPTVELETANVAPEQPAEVAPQAAPTEEPTAAPQETTPEQPQVDFETKPSDASEAEAQKPVEKAGELKAEIETEGKTTASRVSQTQQRNSKARTAPKVIRSSEEEDDEKEEEAPQASRGTKNLAISFPFEKRTLGYKHWSGRHFPTKWVLKLNGQEVLWYDSKAKVFHQKAKTISIDPSKTLTAHFDWEFLGGKRKGWKEIDYKVNADADKLVFAFDWKNEPWQLTISNTKNITTRSSDNKKE